MEMESRGSISTGVGESGAASRVPDFAEEVDGVAVRLFFEPSAGSTVVVNCEIDRGSAVSNTHGYGRTKDSAVRAGIYNVGLAGKVVQRLNEQEQQAGNDSRMH